jgi:hypothetical protein
MSNELCEWNKKIFRKKSSKRERTQAELGALMFRKANGETEWKNQSHTHKRKWNILSETTLCESGEQCLFHRDIKCFGQKCDVIQSSDSQ